MTASISVIHKWGATACLEAAKQAIPNDEKLLILSYDENQQSYCMSANLTHAEGLWLLEQAKFKILRGEM
jgi:hypothetical protein